MAAKRIKLVVAEGHTLGFIFPELPNSLQILHSSILRGSRYPSTGSIMLPKNHRLADAEDFEAFNIHAKGFIGNLEEYEYDTSFHTVLEDNCRFYTRWDSEEKRYKADYNNPIIWGKD